MYPVKNRVKIDTIIVVILAVVAVLLLCWLASEEIELPVGKGVSLLVTPQTPQGPHCRVPGGRMTPVFQSRLPHDWGGVAAVSFSPRATELFIAHSSKPVVGSYFDSSGEHKRIISAGISGKLVTRSILDGLPVRRVLSLGAVGNRGTHFNASGRYLVLSSGGIGEPTAKREREMVPFDLGPKGLEVWDVVEGQKVYGWSAYYGPIDAALSIDGRYAILANPGGYSIESIPAGKVILFSGGSVTMEDSGPAPAKRDSLSASVVSFGTGEQANSYLVGFVKGVVCRGRARQMKKTEKPIRITFGNPHCLQGDREIKVPHDFGIVTSLAQNPLYNVFAIYCQKGLLIDALQRGRIIEQLRHPHLESMIADIKFDRYGELLAVADERGVEVRRKSDDWKVSAFDYTYSATSVAFSPEGCSLAVGGADGGVRVYSLMPEN